MLFVVLQILPEEVPDYGTGWIVFFAAADSLLLHEAIKGLQMALSVPEDSRVLHKPRGHSDNRNTVVGEEGEAAEDKHTCKDPDMDLLLAYTDHSRLHTVLAVEVEGAVDRHMDNPGGSMHFLKAAVEQIRLFHAGDGLTTLRV